MKKSITLDIEQVKNGWIITIHRPKPSEDAPEPVPEKQVASTQTELQKVVMEQVQK